MSIRLLAALLIAALAAVAEPVAADEVDAVINDPSRAFTKRKQETTPGSFNYARLKLDSQGRVISQTQMSGIVTPKTKVVMGKLNEKTMKWSDGEPIEGGIESDLIKTKGKVLRVSISINDDKTIERILVKNPDEKLQLADKEYHALFKQIGRSEGYGTTIWYVRRELDDQGKLVKTFGLTSGFVRKETKIAMGKFNDQTKKWEAGEPIEKGLEADIFKDLGKKNVYVYMIPRDDKQGLAELLVTRVGD